jgi:hypothetical protein
MKSRFDEKPLHHYFISLSDGVLRGERGTWKRRETEEKNVKHLFVRESERKRQEREKKGQREYKGEGKKDIQ